MIPVTVEYDFTNDVFGTLIATAFLALLAYVYVHSSTADQSMRRKTILRGAPLVVLAVTMFWLFNPQSSLTPRSEANYYPTSAQISTFLEEEYGVSVNDENSLGHRGLSVDAGFEMAVDGVYQECKFVSTGTPSRDGYPATVACAGDSSGPWSLLPTRE